MAKQWRAERKKGSFEEGKGSGTACSVRFVSSGGGWVSGCVYTVDKAECLCVCVYVVCPRNRARAFSLGRATRAGVCRLQSTVPVLMVGRVVGAF